uniref:Uncharacterized protein n=1 Tax=Metallosphaera hakonensis JCM 8857 = DSM 7519 TaxID=1293036 RepID=A0A2U9ISC3_9CREN
MISQKTDILRFFILLLIIALLLISLIFPLAIFGAILLSGFSFYLSKTFIPITILIVLLLALHGSFYYIGILLIVGLLVFNFLKYIQRSPF